MSLKLQWFIHIIIIHYDGLNSISSLKPTVNTLENTQIPYQIALDELESVHYIDKSMQAHLASIDAEFREAR